MSNRPTQTQMEALVEFLEQNPGIAKGLLKTQQGKLETRRKWQEFANATNALGGVLKDGPAWSKYWAEKKCALKRQCQQRAQSMRRTGGGVDMLPELSQLELRLVAVMGGLSFATGDRGLSVDPFPHSSSQPSPSILGQPSTSHTAVAEDNIMNFVLVPEEEFQVQNPQQPSAELSQQVDASHQEESNQQAQANRVQSASRRVLRQRLRSRRVSFLDTQVARFEEIEAKRVDAEMLNAQALNKIADAMTQWTQLFSDFLRERRDQRQN